MATKKELEEFADFQDGDDVWVFIRRKEEEGKIALKRKSRGFTSLDLLGLANLATVEIMLQSQGLMKIDYVSREALVEKEEE